jgi:predicted nucleic acid-binding protein
VIDLVIDASVVLKWFRSEGEAHIDEARLLRSAFASGRLVVHAPPLLRLEIVNVAGRRWGWSETKLTDLAGSIEELGVLFTEPQLSRVATWTGRGLIAYDAAYVALAEQETIRLVTDDEVMLAVASAIAIPLVSVSAILPFESDSNAWVEADESSAEDAGSG